MYVDLVNSLHCSVLGTWVEINRSAVSVFFRESCIVFDGSPCADLAGCLAGMHSDGGKPPKQSGGIQRWFVYMDKFHSYELSRGTAISGNLYIGDLITP